MKASSPTKDGAGRVSRALFCSTRAKGGAAPRRGETAQKKKKGRSHAANWVAWAAATHQGGSAEAARQRGRGLTPTTQGQTTPSISCERRPPARPRTATRKGNRQNWPKQPPEPTQASKEALQPLYPHHPLTYHLLDQ